MPRVSSNVSEKIYNELNRDISSGKYGTGEVVPSENELAQKYKVSRFFARKALGKLEQQGLIVNRRGVGRLVTRQKTRLKRLGILDDHSVEFYRTHDPLMPGHVFDWQNGVFKACSENEVTPIHITGKDKTLENRLFLLDQLIQSNIDAFVLKVGLLKPEDINELLLTASNCGIPAICAFNKLDPNGKLDCFYCNQYSVGELTSSYLIEQGHTKIGYIYGELNGDMSNDPFFRYRGISDTMEKHGILIDENSVVCINFSLHYGEWQKNGVAAIDRLNENGSLKDLTALIAFNDEMADGAMTRLEELGYKVPEDISIIGFDNDPRVRHRNLSTGYFNFVEETSRIIELFINKYNNDSHERIMEVIEPVLREGSTVKKINKFNQ